MRKMDKQTAARLRYKVQWEEWRKALPGLLLGLGMITYCFMIAYWHWQEQQRLGRVPLVPLTAEVIGLNPLFSSHEFINENLEVHHTGEESEMLEIQIANEKLFCYSDLHVSLHQELMAYCRVKDGKPIMVVYIEPLPR